MWRLLFSLLRRWENNAWRSVIKVGIMGVRETGRGALFVKERRERERAGEAIIIFGAIN